MPFLAPAIAAIAAFASTAVGTAVLGIGASLAAGFVARRLAPKSKTQGPREDQRPRGWNLELQVETNIPRQVIFGEAAAGSLNYWHLSGANNEVLELVYPLVDHECESLQQVYVDGEPATDWVVMPVTDYFGTMVKIRGLVLDDLESGEHEITAEWFWQGNLKQGQ